VRFGGRTGSQRNASLRPCNTLSERRLHRRNFAAVPPDPFLRRVRWNGETAEATSPNEQEEMASPCAVIEIIGKCLGVVCGEEMLVRGGSYLGPEEMRIKFSHFRAHVVPSYAFIKI
jgi:hypothetical protein